MVVSSRAGRHITVQSSAVHDRSAAAKAARAFATSFGIFVGVTGVASAAATMSVKTIETLVGKKQDLQLKQCLRSDIEVAKTVVMERVKSIPPNTENFATETLRQKNYNNDTSNEDKHETNYSMKNDTRNIHIT